MKNQPEGKKKRGLISRLLGKNETDSAHRDRKLMLEPLEPRVLYSAAPVEAPAEPAPAEEAAHVATAAAAAPATSAPAAPVNGNQSEAPAQSPTGQTSQTETAPSEASAPVPETIGLEEAAAIIESGNLEQIGAEEAAALAAATEQLIVEGDFTPSALQQATLSEVEDLAAVAAERWLNTGLTEEQAAALANITYQIEDLSANILGATEGFVIRIDDDAAGRDWFIDETPTLDEEFQLFAGSETQMVAEIESPADDRIDLLSVVLHEQGHILGLLDQYGAANSGDLMYGVFNEGERRLPVAGQSDGAIAGSLEGVHFATVSSNSDFSSNGAAFTAANGYSGGTNPATIDNWTYTNNSSGTGRFGINGDGNTSGDPFGPANDSATPFYAFLQRNGTLTQDITLEANTTYNFSFLAANRNGQGAGTGSVVIADNSTTYYDSGSQSWNTASFQLEQSQFTTGATFDGPVTITLANTVADPNTDLTVTYGNISVTEAVITYVPITSDADSGISSDKQYTHAIDFGNNNVNGRGTAAINGVVFANGGTGAFPAITGTSQTVGTGSTNLPNSHQGNDAASAHLVDGEVEKLVADMIFNNTAGEIELTGLTVGQEYEFTLYNRQWGVSDRSQTIGFETDGVGSDISEAEHTVSFNADDASSVISDFDATQVYALTYTYTAQTDTLKVYINSTSGRSYHLYGLTNEVINTGTGTNDAPVISSITHPAATGTVTATSNASVTVDNADIASTSGTNNNNINSGFDGHVWSDKPIQGQTFTTGANAEGYDLSSVSLAGANNGTTGDWTVRLGTIDNDGDFQTLATRTGSGIAKNDAWITWEFDAPIALQANTEYAFDVDTAGVGFVTYYDATTPDNYAEGRAYSSGSNGSPADPVTFHNFDRSFHADLVERTAAAFTGAVTETDTTITTSGTLNVLDIDTTDTVALSVESVAVNNASSTFAGTNPLDDATLQAMLAVAPASVNADAPIGDDVTWTFTSGNSGDAAFDFLATGETLVLDYTISVIDTPVVELARYEFTDGSREDSVNSGLIDAGDVTPNGDSSDIFISGSSDMSLVRGDATASSQAGALQEINGAAADGSSEYFEFTITPTDGGPVSLTSLAFDQLADGGTGESTVYFTSSLDNHATTIGSSTVSDEDGTVAQNIALTTAFANLTAPVTFRYSWSDNSDSNDFINRLDNLVINGIDGSIDTTTVTIVLTGANDAPVANPDTNEATEAGGVNNATTGTDATGNVITALESFTGLQQATGTTVDGFATAKNEQVLNSITVDGVTYTDLSGATATTVLGGGPFRADNDATPSADGADALSGLVLSDLVTNSATTKFNFASVVNDGNTAMFFGEIGPDGDPGDAVTIYPTDADGNRIGDFSLAVTAADYGAQLGGMDTTINSTLFFPRLTVFTLDAFTGTGTLTGVAGIEIEDTSGPNVDPNVAGTFVVAEPDSDVDSTDTVGTGNATDLVVTQISHPAVNGGANQAVGTNTVIAGSYGSLTISNDGTYTYTAGDNMDPGQVETDVFTYTLADDEGLSSTTTLTITVTGVEDQVLATDDLTNALENGPVVTIPVTTNDSGTDPGQTLTVIASGTSASGATVGVSGTDLTYDPDSTTAFESLAADATTPDTVAYFLSDGQAATDAAVMLDANDRPLGGTGNNTNSVGGVGVSGNWRGTGTISVIDDDLTYAGYNAPQTGSPQAFQGDFTDFRSTGRSVATPLTGEVWFSYLVENPDAEAAGGIAFNDANGGNSAGFNVEAHGTELRVRVPGGGTQTVTGQFTLNQTSLVVGKLNIGVGDDSLTIWVDPDFTTGGSTAPVFTSTGAYGTDVNAIGVVTYSDRTDTTRTPGGIVDAIRLDNNPYAVIGADYAEVVVTVTGTNDLPIITAKEDGAVTEAIASTGTETDSGTITFTDVDLADTHTASAVFDSTTHSGGQLGSITSVTVNPDTTGTGTGGVATWNYEVDNSAIQFLAKGETIVETYTIAVSDGTLIEAGPGSDITEATDRDTPGADRLNVDRTKFVSLDAGTFEVNDFRLNVRDHTQGGTITPMLLSGTPGGPYTTLWVGTAFDPTTNGDQLVSADGNFTLAAATNVYSGFFTSGGGSAIIALDANNSGTGSSRTDHDSVFSAPAAAGDTVSAFSNTNLGRTYAFEINLVEVSTEEIEITITGTNDTPVPSVAAPVTNLTETTDTSPITSDITVNFIDLDLADTDHTTTISAATTSGVTTGLTLDEDALLNLITVNSTTKTSGSNTGSAALTFSAASTDFDYLAAGETAEITYTASVTDRPLLRIDVNSSGSGTEDGFTALNVTSTDGNGDSVTVDGVTFTVASSDGHRDRSTTNDLTSDFIFDNGAGQAVGLTIDTLPAGLWEAEVYVFDAATTVGDVIIAYQNSSGGETILTNNFTPNADTPFTFQFDAADLRPDGLIFVRENNAANESRLNALVLTPIETETTTFTISVTGTNDAPVLSAITAPAAVTEAADASAQDLVAITGDLPVQDADHGNTLTPSIVGTSTVALTSGGTVPADVITALGASGNLTFGSAITSDGTNQTIGYTYDPGAADLDFIAAGDSLTVTYTVKVNDATADSATQDIVITINGTNDAPVLSAITAPAAVTEAADASAQDLAAITGDLPVQDADHGDTLTPSIVGTSTVALTSGGTVPAGVISALGASGNLTFGSAITSDGTSQTIGYTYDPGAADLDFIAAGDSLTVTYTVKVNDATTDSATQDIVITINGTNDSPEITGTDVSSSLPEGDSQISDSGTLKVVDADTNDTVDIDVNRVVVDSSSTFAGTNPLDNAALLAMMTVSPSSNLAADATAGTDFDWTFASGASSDSAFNFLAIDETLVLDYTITSIDSTSQTTNVGAGGALSGASRADTAGQPRINIDRSTTTTLDAGTYSVPSFSFNADSRGSGAIRPFLVTESTRGTYTTVWVGDAVDAVGGVQTVSVTGDTFTLTSTETVYAGIYHDGTDRIKYVNGGGGSTDHDGSPTEPGGLDETVSGISHQNLGRTYAFGVEISEIPNADTEVVRVTITGTNDGPTAVADTENTTENASVTKDVITNDTDTDVTDVLSLKAGSATVTSAKVGTAGADITISDATVTQSGDSVTFNPGTDFDFLAAGETATVVIGYTVQDDHTTPAEANGTLTITVTGTNDGPTAVPDTDGTTENASVTKDVISNDTDVDGTDVLSLKAGSASMTSAKVGTAGADITISDATVIQSGNSVTFNPGTDFDFLAAGEIATVVIGYTVQDDHTTPAEADGTLTITVTGTNDGPIAVADTDSTTENASVTKDVIFNDTDVDGTDALSLKAGSPTVTSAKVGTAGADITISDATVTQSGNSVTFNPGTDFDFLAAGETATVVIGYTVQDDHTTPAEANGTLTVTVTGTNDAPAIAAGDTSALTEGSATTLIDAGSLAFTDVDLTDTHSLAKSRTGTTWSGGATLPTGLTTALDAAFNVSLDPDSTSTGSGTIDWSFSLADTSVDFLATNETLTVTYEVTVTDDDATTPLSDKKNVVVTITGINDAPVPTDATLVLAVTAPNDFLVHTVAANDVDLTGNPQFSIIAGNPEDPDNAGSFAFAIDPTLGRITVNDSELLAELVGGDTVLTVQVDDGKGGITTADITIQSIDRDLFISEYVEGSGSNQAIELYNPTTDPLDLSNYTLEIYPPGSTTAVEIPLDELVFVSDPNDSDPDGPPVTAITTLDPGKTLVIINPAAAIAVDPDETDLYDVANASHVQLVFDGNDTIVLKHGPTITDMIGSIGNDPGTEWATATDEPGADPSHSTGDQTLTRKPGIFIGNPVGFDNSTPERIEALSGQWTASEADNFANLGGHTISVGGGGELPASDSSGRREVVVIPRAPETGGTESAAEGEIPAGLTESQFVGIQSAFGQIGRSEIFGGFIANALGDSAAPNLGVGQRLFNSDADIFDRQLPALGSFIPFFAGAAPAGTFVEIVIRDSTGAEVASGSNLTGSGGVWAVTLPGAEGLTGSGYHVEVRMSGVTTGVATFNPTNLITADVTSQLTPGVIFGFVLDAEGVDQAIEQLQNQTFTP